MKKIDIASINEKIGEKIIIKGWVDTIRNHGKVIFVDLRDRSASVQLVISNKEIVESASNLNVEDLIGIEGIVKKRPEKLINQNILLGGIEVDVASVSMISNSVPLPFEINKDTKKINESSRLEYRYLDLRTERMKKNLETRSQVNLFLRNYLSKIGFWEIETPCLTKGTPEGAREFIVPSRLHHGNFYVLPQSPQQFKQLLMIGGIEKYYQIARCFRDEDQRGDRQPEFTQLDMEMSFVDEEDVLELIEKMIIDLVNKLFPNLKIEETPFPRFTYEEALEKYKSDKPDLRKDKDKKNLYFCWITHFPLFEYDSNMGKISSCHHPFTHPKDEDIKSLDKNPLSVKAKAYDLVLNGYEIGGGSIRIHDKNLQEKIFNTLGLTKEEIDSRFGHLLKAFGFSPPPHGGIALGLDRLLSVLRGEENIREVIAFPKTSDAKDLLCGSPSSISNISLREAGINIAKK